MLIGIFWFALSVAFLVASSWLSGDASSSSKVVPAPESGTSASRLSQQGKRPSALSGSGNFAYSGEKVMAINRLSGSVPTGEKQKSPTATLSNQSKKYDLASTVETIKDGGTLPGAVMDTTSKDK